MTTPEQSPAWNEREVYALLGLPIDALDTAQTLARIRQAVARRQRLFLSTPNINFAMAARQDADFRASVQRSDLVVADGMPLVWIARLLGLPIHERVAGADLFDRLLQEPGPPIKVYFFGGPDGAAATAHAAVNARGGALTCVGHRSPGFESVDALSAPAHIDAINACEPDLLVVSLGARKGQEWIVRNLELLHTPVISHLGAVVNFAAGTVARSPSWMRRTGLEWIGRIIHEPKLWRRYRDDSISFASVVIRDVLPAWWRRQRTRPTPSTLPGGLSVTLDETWALLTPHGNHPGAWTELLATALAQAAQQQRSVRIDLHRVGSLNERALGLLMLAQVRVPLLSVVHADATAKRALRAQGLADDESQNR